MPKPVRKMQKNNAIAQARVLPKIPPELLDQLVKGPMSAEAVEDASRAFKKALIERDLGGEMRAITWVMPSVRTSRRQPATTATGAVARQFSPMTGRCASRCRVTAKGNSNPG